MEGYLSIRETAQNGVCCNVASTSIAPKVVFLVQSDSGAPGPSRNTPKNP